MFSIRQNTAILITRYLLRIAIAFAFAYAGIAGLMTPSSWVGYLPSFVSYAMPPTVALTAWSIFEIFFAGYVLTGWRDRFVGFLAAILLVLMVVFNVSQISILFRDLSLAVAAAALAVLDQADI